MRKALEQIKPKDISALESKSTPVIVNCVKAYNTLFGIKNVKDPKMLILGFSRENRRVIDNMKKYDLDHLRGPRSLEGWCGLGGLVNGV